MDDRVWVCKSHHPCKLLSNPIIERSKLLIVVRNPLDVIYSIATYASTINHAAKMPFKTEDYPEYWDWFVRTMAKMLADYFKILLDDCSN